MRNKTNPLKLFLYFLAIILFITLTNSCKERNNKSNSNESASNSSKDNLKEQENKLLKIIDTNKDSLLPKENLIQFYRINYQYDKAISTVDTYLSKDTNNIRLMHIKSVLLLEKSDTIATISNLEKTINIYPSALDLVMLGAIYANQCNAKSIQISNILLRDFKEFGEAEAYFIRGSYYSNTGDKKNAIEQFNRCISHTITFMEAYREKALALASIKKYDEAINTLNKALILNNNYPEGYFYLGEILEKTNNTDGALEAYQKALLYDTGYIEAANAIKRLTK